MDIKVKMPGMIRFYNVNKGDIIKAGMQIASMEALQTEHKLICDIDGVVKNILVPTNTRISAGTVIMIID